MVTIVSISDLHLDVRTQGRRRKDEIASALHQAKGTAIARKMLREEVLFVCAGDLGDPDSGSIVYPLLALCIEVMQELEKNGIRQVWVKGNHDGESGESLFTPLAALAEGMKLAGVSEVPDRWGWADVDVLALPHAKYDPVKEVGDFAKWREERRSTDFLRPAVVVSHLFPILGIEPGEESSEMPRGGPMPLPCEELAKVPGPVLILSGHYHRRQVHQPPVKGCPPVHVIGSAVQLSHSEESNSPGFLVIHAP
jgi:DNA repair exonuclease SbcCD nuclease subunit